MSRESTGVTKAADARVKGYEDMSIKSKDEINDQNQNGNAWLGPAKDKGTERNWV